MTQTMREQLRLRDVKQGTKLKCIWYPWITYSMGRPYGLTPSHPKLGEIVTVDRVLNVLFRGPRVLLKEHYCDYEGFPLSSFELAENEVKP